MRASQDPRFSEASASPHIARLLVQLLRNHGVAAIRLCWGLGFTVSDLYQAQARVSHRQSYLFVKRVMAKLGDEGLGLTLGSMQSAVSLGFVGLGMQASATLGEALALGLRFQKAAGAMLDYQFERQGDCACVTVQPRFYEPEVALFYVEEAFASALKVVQHLTAQLLQPIALNLAYAAPKHASRYDEMFGCPVRFEQDINSMVWDAECLALPLATADAAVVCDVIYSLEQSHGQPQTHSDLIETLDWAIRNHLKQLPTLAQLAEQIHVSERTLRRRIEAAGLSFQALVDEARRTRALALMAQPRLKLDHIALELGFSDARNFRRAFHRWTGVSPRQARKKLLTDQGEDG